jgi:hypothetical protein
MEPFFIEENFYSKVEDYLIDHELEKDDVDKLPDDWEIKVNDAELQPIFVLKEDWVIDQIVENTDHFEERFPEDSDKIFEDIKKAIKQSLDINKLNELLPKLWYPNGKEVSLTKQDLLDACD